MDQSTTRSAVDGEEALTFYYEAARVVSEQLADQDSTQPNLDYNDVIEAGKSPLVAKS